MDVAIVYYLALAAARHFCRYCTLGQNLEWTDGLVAHDSLHRQRVDLVQLLLWSQLAWLLCFHREWSPWEDLCMVESSRQFALEGEMDIARGTDLFLG